jgi:hypothetical protein
VQQLKAWLRVLGQVCCWSDVIANSGLAVNGSMRHDSVCSHVVVFTKHQQVQHNHALCRL